MKRECSTVSFNPIDLLLAYLASQGCRHEWIKHSSNEERFIFCSRCGLTAYTP